MKLKKGSLELSINAIIIIVLALTLLGLGLAFIRNQITSLGDTTTAVQEQIRQQILDDLRTGNKKLSFPTSEIKIQSNGETVVAIGVKNVEDNDLNFRIEMYDLTTPGAETLLTSGTATGSRFFWDTSNQVLSVGEANVYGIKLFAPQGADTYLYKVKIIDLDETDPSKAEYSSKTFFVRVT